MFEFPAVALVTFSVITFVTALRTGFPLQVFESFLTEVKVGNNIPDENVAQFCNLIDRETDFMVLAKQFHDKLEATYSSTGRFGHESKQLSDLIQLKLEDSSVIRILRGTGGNGVNGKYIFVDLLLQNVPNVECVAFPGPNGTHPLGEGYFKPKNLPTAGEIVHPTVQAFEDLQDVINSDFNFATKVKANTHYLLGKKYMDVLFEENEHGTLEDKDGTLKDAISLLKGLRRPDGHADPLEIEQKAMSYWNAARIVMEYQLNEIEKNEASVKIEAVIGVNYNSNLEIIPYLANLNMKKVYKGKKPKTFAIDNVMGITSEGEPKEKWNLRIGIGNTATSDSSYEADMVFQCYRKKSTVNYKKTFCKAVEIIVPDGKAFCKPIEDILSSKQNHTYKDPNPLWW